MIVRSGAADLDKLLEAIVETRILGSYDEQEIHLFRLVHPDVNKLERIERDREGRNSQDGTISPAHKLFGFWLPHGLSSNPQKRAAEIESCIRRCEDIENAFCQLEGEEEIRRLLRR
jgi:hypothetical protein